MQVAQNKCIRYCLNLGNRAHIGIKEFEKINWLPTKERFEQCVCVGIFNFFVGVALTYISERVQKFVTFENFRFWSIFLKMCIKPVY